MELYELWILLQNWKEEFSAAEFISIFPSPNPNKILHDLAKKELVEKIGWGKYRINTAKEVGRKRYNIAKSYEIVGKAGLEYSFTGPDAVFIWTHGGYQVDRSLLSYPIHLKIKNLDIKKWVKFFGRKKVIVKGKELHRTYFGIFYFLEISDKISKEKVDNLKVDSLAETVKFCENRIYSYEPALEMLDEMYNLGLKIKYKEVKTNVG